MVTLVGMLVFAWSIPSKITLVNSDGYRVAIVTFSAYSSLSFLKEESGEPADQKLRSEDLKDDRAYLTAS